MTSRLDAIWRWRRVEPPSVDDVEALVAVARAAEAQGHHVRSDQGGAVCTVCRDPWPCATSDALRPLLAEEAT